MARNRSPDPDCIDEFHTLLANRHRRATLRYFRDASAEVASLNDIADEISDHGGEERARRHLHHYALPRLADADVVEYDVRSNTVRYRSSPRLDRLLESLPYF